MGLLGGMLRGFGLWAPQHCSQGFIRVLGRELDRLIDFEDGF